MLLVTMQEVVTLFSRLINHSLTLIRVGFLGSSFWGGGKIIPSVKNLLELC